VLLGAEVKNYSHCTLKMIFRSQCQKEKVDGYRGVEAIFNMKIVAVFDIVL
jgi:hypothetical protein